jgi:hypothetical protein
MLGTWGLARECFWAQTALARLIRMGSITDPEESRAIAFRWNGIRF